MRAGTKAAKVSSFPNICRPQDLKDRSRIYDQIALRALELCQARGCEPGHDWEYWRQAEAEFLCPVSVDVQDHPDNLIVRATVIGFAADDLDVCIVPRCLIVASKESTRATPGAGPTVDVVPKVVFRIIELPAPIVPGRSIVSIRDGSLEFELPKDFSDNACAMLQARALWD